MLHEYTMDMERYGLSGGNETGKSTMAEFLHDEVEAAEHVEFSDPIRDVANEWLGSLPEIPKNSTESDIIQVANAWISDLPQALRGVIGAETVPDSFFIDADNPERYETMHKKLIEYLYRFTDGETAEYIHRENKLEHVALLQWLGYTAREFIQYNVWPDEIRRRVNELSRENTELLTIGGVRYEHDAQFVRSIGGTVVKIHREAVASNHNYHTETADADWEADVNIHNDGTLVQLRKAARILRGDDCPTVILAEEL